MNVVGISWGQSYTGRYGVTAADSEMCIRDRANPLPALGYFMEHFLPSFELTLDELN